MAHPTSLVSILCAIAVAIAPGSSFNGLLPLELQGGDSNAVRGEPGDVDSSHDDGDGDEKKRTSGLGPVPSTPLIVERAPLGAELIKPIVRSTGKVMARGYRAVEARDCTVRVDGQVPCASLSLAELAPRVRSHAPPRL